MKKPIIGNHNYQATRRFFQQDAGHWMLTRRANRAYEMCKANPGNWTLANYFDHLRSLLNEYDFYNEPVTDSYGNSYVEVAS